LEEWDEQHENADQSYLDEDKQNVHKCKTCSEMNTADKAEAPPSSLIDVQSGVGISYRVAYYAKFTLKLSGAVNKSGSELLRRSTAAEVV
jgi:hypothetical protein